MSVVIRRAVANFAKQGWAFPADDTRRRVTLGCSFWTILRLPRALIELCKGRMIAHVAAELAG